MIRSVLTWIARSREVARSRRQLAALDARALEDLGLTPADVEAECARPFWDWGSYDPRRVHGGGRPAVARCRHSIGY